MRGRVSVFDAQFGDRIRCQGAERAAELKTREQSHYRRRGALTGAEER